MKYDFKIYIGNIKPLENEPGANNNIVYRLTQSVPLHEN